MFIASTPSQTSLNNVNGFPALSAWNNVCKYFMDGSSIDTGTGLLVYTTKATLCEGLISKPQRNASLLARQAEHHMWVSISSVIVWLVSFALHFDLWKQKYWKCGQARDWQEVTMTNETRREKHPRQKTEQGRDRHHQTRALRQQRKTQV